MPDISILLIADALGPAMKTLCRYAEGISRERLEVVVVSRNSTLLSETPLLAEGFSRVRMASVDSESYDAAEAHAVRVATAPFVVFAQAEGCPRPGYLKAAKAAIDSGEFTAVGPAVAILEPGGWSWAAGWILYGPWLHEPSRGEVQSIAGHHSLYRRKALLGLGDELDRLLVAGDPLLAELRARGHCFLVEPAAVVEIRTAICPREFLECLFFNSRIYASKRCLKWSVLRRLAYVFGSPLIPLVRLPRILKQIRRSKRQWELWSQFPFLFFGLVISTAGEMIGYLQGQGRAWRFEPRTKN